MFPSPVDLNSPNMKVMSGARDGAAVEAVLRGACTEMGSKAAVTFPPLTRHICQKYGAWDMIPTRQEINLDCRCRAHGVTGLENGTRGSSLPPAK